ncbi:ATP-binding protein [Jatrophihabitans sp.]|uniref:ATP-binding protein n=1 Tax=Jatrophihabitans sp. TaxID=1932789 RepID=UPI0030C6E506
MPAPEPSHGHSRLAGGIAVVGTVAIAFGLARLGSTQLRDPAAGAATWWPSGAVATVVLLTLRRRSWLPALVLFGLATAAANLAGDSSAATAAAFGLANAAEAGAAAAIIQAWGRRRDASAEPSPSEGPTWRSDPLAIGWHLTSRQAAAQLVVGAALGVLGGTFVLGIVDLIVGNGLPSSQLGGYLRAHLVGQLILTPVLILLPRGRGAWAAFARAKARNFEWLTEATVILSLTTWIFWIGGPRTPLETGLLVLVPMFTAAARLDPLRAALTAAAVASVAAVGTVHGNGVEARISDPHERLWAFQLLLVVLSIGTVWLSLRSHSRAQSRAALRDSEQFASVTFTAAPTGMFVVSLAPGSLGRFLHVNEAFCQLLKRSASELEGQHVSIAGVPADARVVEQNLLEMQSGALDSYTREKSLLRSDGIIVPCSQSINVVRRGGAEPYFLAQVTDLTAQKSAEEALLAALHGQLATLHDMESLHEQRKQSVARLSHDLRTPLTSVLGYHELLLDGDPGSLDDSQREMLTIAERNATRVRDLVDDLVEVMGREADALQVAGPGRVDVDELLVHIVDTLRPLCARNDQVLVGYETKTGAIVAGSESQLERALLNIATNAAKYTPAHGQITIAAEVHRGRVAITISDTGIGIPAEQIPRIGEQFFRADTARDRLIDGYGLGLAITKAVITNLGGEIAITSEVGFGSTFTTTLPTIDGNR